MLHLHNDIFLTDIIVYDRLNLVTFIPPKDEILGAPLVLRAKRMSRTMQGDEIT